MARRPVDFTRDLPGVPHPHVFQEGGLVAILGPGTCLGERAFLCQGATEMLLQI